ncbi:NAD dependent epimerase/dehydratase [Pullulanibacillus camelliae]|uniref:UDP-glucose 4-epimerase n=1 Tax=Pullulanibacillus camelliae TaxID=1707096 RepID=A0A8J2YKE7_9BACL|nr:NAD-dependent epimerase/dehydratase family protein [Pullulanibacillus camelliae]GGE50985.1 NAD dependent epimerase/dehydratase [Pullulanibacillus camelliae]
MRILVLGGTQFFGRRLVHLLLDEGHDVTIATRGQSPDDFGDAVTRIRVDRTEREAMIKAFADQSYDVIYDQICFNPREAKIAVDVFADRVKRYILTSSMAVYKHKDGELVEEDFLPEQYPYDLEAHAYTYAEGKRQAEAYFYQKAAFPVVAVRVAMVVSGTDDFTGRFDYYVSHVATEASIGVFSTEHPISYVTAWDIAEFLKFMGIESDFVGPINGNNSGHLSIQMLCQKIGECLGKEPIFHVGTHEDKTLSPYAMFTYDWRLSNDRAAALGFHFPAIVDVLPSMVKESAERLGLS